MKQSYSVDEIFKEQLSEIDFPQKEKMWKLMEEKLQKDNAAGKRRIIIIFASLALVLLLTIPALKLGDNVAQKKSAPNNNLKEHYQASADNTSLKNNTDAVIINSNTLINNSSSITVKENTPAENTYKQNRTANISRFKTSVSITSPSVFTAEETSAELNSQTRITAQFDLLTSKFPGANNKLAANHFPLVASNSTPEKNVKRSNKKSPFAIEAGVDLLRRKQDIGFYAGVTVEKVINPQVSLTTGLNFSKNTLSQSYSIANKVPPFDKVIDANLHSMSMVRLPVHYNQKLPNSRVTAKAGLTAVYILSANITNVPNSYVGNPADYRKFTLDDINRFNLLFSAGVNYKVSPRLAVEINGHFGLTDQVKDKFVNQSNVNDNMKSLQAGVVYKFK